MGAIKKFLGSYGENFALALLLWPVVSLMLTDRKSTRLNSSHDN